MALGDLIPDSLISNRLMGIFGDPNAQSSAPNDPNAPPQPIAPPDLNQLLIQRITQPDPNIDRLNEVYNSMPQRPQPSMMRKIGAAIIGMGYGPKAAHDYLYQPYNDQMDEWGTKAALADKIAGLDVNKEKADITGAINQQKVQNSATKADETNQFKYDQLNQDFNITQQKLQAAKDALDQSEKDKADTRVSLEAYRSALEAHRNAADALAAENASLRAQLTAANIKHLGAEDTHLGVENTVAQNKPAPGTKPTTATQQMMEGAQMLLPHVSELDNLAKDLDRRGLFGPVMSRVRDLAAKVGTTGDPGKVQQDLENFGNSLTTDPQLRQSNDAAVGQFLTTLGLMASGAGRVHGGARGGGSIQMVQYIKALLSSDSTYSMFKGRLNGLNSFLKTYAAGPQGAAQKNPLDKAIDDIFGVQK